MHQSMLTGLLCKQVFSDHKRLAADMRSLPQSPPSNHYRLRRYLADSRYSVNQLSQASKWTGHVSGAWQCCAFFFAVLLTTQWTLLETDNLTYTC